MTNDKRIAVYARQRNLKPFIFEGIAETTWSLWNCGHKITRRQYRRWVKKHNKPSPLPF